MHACMDMHEGMHVRMHEGRLQTVDDHYYSGVYETSQIRTLTLGLPTSLVTTLALILVLTLTPTLALTLTRRVEGRR